MSTSMPTRPPPPTRKPGQIKVVRSLYAFEAQKPDELSFDEGEALYIIDQSDSNWWKAKCGDRTGLIPSNYVQENTESIDLPLHEAAKRGNIGFLTECIKNQVSVNSLDKAGSTPLHWAAHGGHTSCINILLSVKNCEVNVQNKLGDTPLHAAAWRGHTEAVQLLLSHDWNSNQVGLVECPGPDRAPCTMRAVGGSLAMRFSEFPGVIANIKNNDNKLPYDLAKNTETAALLRQAVAPRLDSSEYGDEEDSD